MEASPRRYQTHIFVCVNDRDFGKECCAKKGSIEILQKLREHVNTHGLMGMCNVTKTLCLGHCLAGPTVVVYPEGVTYTYVAPEDVQTIIDNHLRG